MPRTTADAGADFDNVRHQRALADKLRGRGEMTDAQWQARQNELGPLDRQYFAEWATTENPVSALALAGLIPAEYLAKKLRLRGGRSEPTVESMLAGYRGIGAGLSNYTDRVGRKLIDQPSRLP